MWEKRALMLPVLHLSGEYIGTGVGLDTWLIEAALYNPGQVT